MRLKPGTYAACALLLLAGCNSRGSSADPAAAGAAPAPTPAPVGSPTATPSAPPGPTPSPGPSATPGASPGSTPVVTLDKLELAQTHVLAPAGRQWTTPSGQQAELHLVGQREALALVDFAPSGLGGARLEGRRSGQVLGRLALQPPSSLPATEGDGPAYSSTAHSAVLPAGWLQAGLQLRVTADNATPSAWADVLVGSAPQFTVRILPFYLFGADETDVGLAIAGTPSAAAIDEMWARWPVATVHVGNHPAQKVSWPRLVVGPRTDRNGQRQPAYVVASTDDYRDGYAGLATVHGILRGLMDANGESSQAVQYYAPLLARNAGGALRSAGGGIGGGDAGTGDTAYAGIFIHEQGHAFGLPHAGDAYDAGKYPYAWGSLDGSAWGYDASHNEFLPPFIPTTSGNYADCRSDSFAGHARAVDAAGRCVKQDPMQSGAGDQGSGYRFATFSDFNTALMQRYFEGTTALEGDGTHNYGGGKLQRDAGFPGGYKRWDAIDQDWVSADTATTDGGLGGFDRGTPLQVGVPVYSIVVTMSHAGTAGATQIYPPIRYTGNLMRTIDPTDDAQRASIVPNTGTYYWYCRAYGCDYTLRVAYGNGTIRHVVLQRGFRSWFGEQDPTPAAASDPLDSSSFRRWVVNVPDDGDIASIQLLDTPMVWNGMPALPTVLASR